nr:hypothetical protein [Planctomycetota bacterium]
MLLTSWLKRLIEQRSVRVKKKPKPAQITQLGLTRLEERVVLNVGPVADVLVEDPLATVEVDDGDLVVTDEAGQDDNLSITVSGSKYVIESQNGKLIAGNGATQVDENTIEVLQDSVTGEIDIDLLQGEDTLTVDFGGRLDWAPIVYDGGEAGFDSLIIEGTDGYSTSYNFINASDGDIRFSDGVSTAELTFIGLEPITDVNVVPDRLFDFTGATETITLSDDGTAGDGFSLIDSTLAESVTFAHPTNSLTILTTNGSGNDTVNIEGLDSTFDADLIITTDTGDTVNFQTTATDIGSGDLTVTAPTFNGFDTGAATEFTTTGTATFDISGGTARLQSSFDLSAASFTSTSNVIQLDAGAGIATGGGNIAFNANLATINEGGAVTIDAGAGNVMFAPVTSTQLIEFGQNSNSGRLELSSGELDTVTASVLQLGNSSHATALFQSQSTTLTSATTLSLVTGGTITQNVGSTLTVPSLVAQSGTLITFGQAGNDVDQIAFDVTGSGQALFFGSSNVTVTSLVDFDGNTVTGVSTVDDAVQLSSGSITVNEMINARTNNQVQLTASTGNVQINAPVISTALATGALGDGSGALTLTASTGSIDVGSSLGTATASGAVSLTAQSGVTLSAAASSIRTSGSLTIDADSNNSGTGDFSVTDASATVNISNNSITIDAADVRLDGPLTGGTGQINLTPSQSTAVALGNPVGNFNLDNSDLANITTTNGLSFGTNASSLTVDGVTAAATANFPSLVLDPDSATVDVSFVNNPSVFADDFDITVTLDIADLNLTQAVTLGEGGATPQGTGTFAVTSNNGSTLNQTGALTVGSGGISFLLAQSTAVVSSGGFVSSGPVQLTVPSATLSAPVTLTGAGQDFTVNVSTIALDSAISTTGGVVAINGAATLNENTSIDTTASGGAAAGGDVTFNSVRAETAASGEVLSIEAGTGGDISIGQLTDNIGL